MFLLKEDVFLFWVWSASIFFPKAYSATGLQGVPTWICLGLKSPFIEFGSHEEQLANTSIPLNITKDEQAYMHQEGLRKLGTFIKPVDLRDSETGFVKPDHTKRLTFNPPNLQSPHIHPIQEEMDQKNIILLDDDTDENGLPASLTDEDRKFIVPMALKNISPDSQWGTSTSSTVRLPNTKLVANFSVRQNNSPSVHIGSPLPQESDPTSNIDDLKKHILFLHNMTKTNTNFESKFVKFPSLQKDKPMQIGGSSAINSKRPQRPIFQYAAPIAHPTRKMPQDHANSHGREQVDGNFNNDENLYNVSYISKPINNSNSVMPLNKATLSINPKMSLLNETESSTKQRANPLIKSTTDVETHLRTTKRPACLRNPDSTKCLRQLRKEEQQRQRDRDEWFRGQAEYIQPRFQPIIQTINNTKRFAVSIEIPDSFKIQSESEFLSRAQRSPRSSRKRMSDEISKEKFENLPHKTDQFNKDIVMTSAEIASDREFFIANIEKLESPRENQTNNNSTDIPKVYFEPIDLNPKNCYKVSGLTSNQRKQCIKNTSVMPAISRGARAAIQECKFQFKNRRWNCSTSGDETVFGPVTSLAAPEMAFIHALAAATVTSFIARACRDGQLASCGCSRGSRPKQLHDDWTWGGCGDNLEYAYKFATDFIDVREKEANRDVKSITRKQARDASNGSLKSGKKKNREFQTTKKNSTEFLTDENKMSMLKTNNGQIYMTNKKLTPNLTEIQKEHNSDTSSKKYLLELQQRISKEILNSKMKGEELIELQDQINHKIINWKFLNGQGSNTQQRKGKRKNQRAVQEIGKYVPSGFNAKVNYEIETIYRSQQPSAKAKSLMNLHNNEAGRRAVIKKTRITCKCHGVSGSCSLITCWQQLSSIREIAKFLPIIMIM
ncbi:protein Wnt-5 isoform X2 [Drosophila ananassae]|uniref:protein Wnt-5 isoform X2 n=1 Tax=Drosophila ananassae TaxID=7217 RepID=UPI001CFFED0F|nr:protein Wnt-5 isoform X2 [Drosophila ananassae]